jgi:hypothetical protein
MVAVGDTTTSPNASLAPFNSLSLVIIVATLERNVSQKRAVPSYRSQICKGEYSIAPLPEWRTRRIAELFGEIVILISPFRDCAVIGIASRVQEKLFTSQQEAFHSRAPQAKRLPSFVF